jgi:hypothetical protein
LCLAAAHGVGDGRAALRVARSAPSTTASRAGATTGLASACANAPTTINEGDPWLQRAGSYQQPEGLNCERLGQQLVVVALTVIVIALLVITLRM